MSVVSRNIKYNTHPGEILYEMVIKENGLSVESASQLLGVTRPTLSNILNCKSAISPLMAIRLSKVFGGNPELWIRLQSAYELRKAEQEYQDKKIELKKFESV